MTGHTTSVRNESFRPGEHLGELVSRRDSKRLVECYRAHCSECAWVSSQYLGAGSDNFAALAGDIHTIILDISRDLPDATT